METTFVQIHTMKTDATAIADGIEIEATDRVRPLREDDSVDLTIGDRVLAFHVYRLEQDGTITIDFKPKVYATLHFWLEPIGGNRYRLRLRPHHTDFLEGKLGREAQVES